METIEIWKVPLYLEDTGLEALERLLSPDESARAAAFRFPDGRRRYSASRGALRAILSHYTGEKPADLLLTATQAGKPELAGRSAVVHFNVSHSQDTCLIAVSRSRPVGIDVETIKPDIELEKIAERFFTLGEYEALMALPEDLRLKAFYRCWTFKEAYVKALGSTMWELMEKVEVSLDLSEPPAIIHGREPLEEWFLAALPLGETLAGALASPGKEAPIAWHTFQGP
ncbi:MAG: 4'-phosphopantetheinyl transferase superfamily protein [Candidatus Eremiobacteraeota bacterium]|nr:4'-phosphopantetheinyl transferase superfamily protein [Candidatus Eremiobacteraeota bacterium]